MTPTAAWRKSHAVTAKWEGTWSDDPDDSGGPTMGGVTQATFNDWLERHGQPRRSVATITRAEAEQIFFENYWLAAGCDELVPGVDLATYDASVNSGVGRGRKWLLASLDPANDHAQTVRNICARRSGFVQGLGNFWKFGRGWLNRIADIEATGVAWALAIANDNAVVSRQLSEESDVRSEKAVGASKSATGTGAGAGGAVAADQVSNIGDWLLTAVGVVLVVLTAYLIWRAVLRSKQATAFERVARETANA